MVNQTLISFKIDSSRLVELDKICSDLNVKRNKFLNFLVWYAIYNSEVYPHILQIMELRKQLSSLDIDI